MRIIPSIASADPLRIGAEIDKLGGCPCLHIDIEDGTLVPDITFGMRTVRAIAGHTDAELDVHMMIDYPDRLIPELAACGIRRVCAQVEALAFPARFLEGARAAGMSPGLAMTMKTPIETVRPYGDRMDYLLLLASEPDGAGQRFMFPAFDKLRRLRALLPPVVALWVDGGVGEAMLPGLAACGADTAVMGRAIWEEADPAAAIARMRAGLD